MLLFEFSLFQIGSSDEYTKKVCKKCLDAVNTFASGKISYHSTIVNAVKIASEQNAQSGESVSESTSQTNLENARKSLEKKCRLCFEIDGEVSVLNSEFKQARKMIKDTCNIEVRHEKNSLIKTK